MQAIEQPQATEKQRRTLRDRGICIVIPTYNNARTIVDVVTRAKSGCDDVIVVCDGCTDGTAELLHNIQGIILVRHNRNRGKGAALKSGFRKALEMGYAYAITLDADGQHFPEDIGLMLQANIETPGALIVGCRRDLEQMTRSAGSKFANKFSNFWFCIQTGQRLADTQSGYRLYPLKKLHGLHLLTSRYEAELELLVLAAWHGVKIASVSVGVYYPPEEERVSHFRPVLDFTRISVLNTILCILAVLYAVPLALLRFLSRLLITVYSILFFSLSALFVVAPSTLFYCLTARDVSTRQHKLRKLLHRFAKFIMVWHGIPRVKFRCHTTGVGALSKASIIICNHQSHLDLMALMSQTENIVFMTNDWVWRSPLYGYAIRKAGYILSTNGIEAAEKHVRQLIDQRVNVAIFPEGTRSADCKIRRFHSGAFHLAQSLGVNITPAIIYGAGGVMPKNRKIINPGIIELHIDKSIEAGRLEGKSARSLASEMRKYYQTRYTEISNKVDQDV